MSSDSTVSLDASTASIDSSSPDSTPSQLYGREDDPIIPTAFAISSMFHDGQSTWQRFMDLAQQMPIGCFASGSLNPYLTLVDVPALPLNLPRTDLLRGRPLWHTPGRAPRGATLSRSNEWDPDLVHGQLVTFVLETVSPLSCGLSKESTSCSNHTSPSTRDSLAVLTLCWAYILSARFVELQGSHVEYTKHCLQPCNRAQNEQHVICLDGASSALTRWLSAVLSPQLGWRPAHGHLPPWAASFGDSAGIALQSSESKSKSHLGKAPDSAQATKLLLEICRLFGLGGESGPGEPWESLAPFTAGFYAALLLPFYRLLGLRPQLPPPQMTRALGPVFKAADRALVRQYVRDARYFMALVLDPATLGSVLWSIFWQPDVECNLASPWLASMIDVLGPAISSQDVELLFKVFALRRPRVAPWWLALFLLGDAKIFNWITRYAETFEEQTGYATMSTPSPTAAVWAGSRQSFLDENAGDISCEESTKEVVSRAALLRCRFDFKLQDSAYLFVPWRPFGCISKHDIEPDLWPYLESNPSRRYLHFTWYVEKQPQPPSLGFRHDTRRVVKANHDDLALLRARPGSCKGMDCACLSIRLLPSELSTQRMVWLLADDMAGRSRWAHTGLPPELQKHPWLQIWSSFCMDDWPLTAAEQDKADRKPLSWFLVEWLRGKHSGSVDKAESRSDCDSADDTDELAQ